MKAWRKVRTAIRLPLREKLWFLLLYPLSGCIRLSTSLLPFRWLAKLLGKRLTGSAAAIPPVASVEQEARAVRIGKTCELVSRYTPWECKCLVQSVMARVVLGWYGIPWRVRIGVGNEARERSLLRAHAWTQVGGQVVTGRRGYRDLQELCVFGPRKS